MLATPALGRLIRGRVRPLISLAYLAPDQVPRLVRAAHMCLVPARVRSLAVQLRNTATRPTSIGPGRPPVARDVGKQPLPTTLPAVRDEEAVGSNPATPTV